MATTPRRRWHAVARCAGVIGVVAVVVAMLALQCDVYGAFAENSILKLDGSGIQTLLASLGLDGTLAAR
ncbi:MAG: hypothetical protein JSR41_23045 [Proteobacteria bacterium]|nr:hypothetical protein [Pseudomonadota bacterium]